MMEAARASETLVNFYQTTLTTTQKTAIFALTAVRTSNPTTSETLANFYQTTRRYNPEDSHILPLK
jgi:hypothetical protein